MPRRNWKKVQAGNLKQANDLCLQYAKEKHNRSVEMIADLMGVNHWTLYKWADEGKMPINRVPSFEHACGIDFVSRWLAMRANKLVIDIPNGSQGNADDIFALQESTNQAIGVLLNFYAHKKTVEETLGPMQNALERMAWHKGNVEKYHQPEIPFDEDER